MKFEDLIFEVLTSGKEICVDASEKLIREILEMVKKGKLKPTILANPAKRIVNLYMPYGEGRIHVVVKEDKVCVHYDKYDPIKKPLEHIIADTDIPKRILVLAAIAILKYIIFKKLQKGRG